MNKTRLTALALDYLVNIKTFIGIVIANLFFLFDLQTLMLLAIAAFIVYLGITLPLNFNKRKRASNARKNKEVEKNKWGFHSLDRKGPWINFIDYPVVKESCIAKDRYFYSEWLIIHDGKIIVNPGHANVNLTEKQVTYKYADRRTYAWDGCTPKRVFYWLFVVGTPDLWRKASNLTTLSDTKEPKSVKKTVLWKATMHASLVHDALYQYLHEIPITKEEVDWLFYIMLRKSGLPKTIARIYLYAVTNLGDGKYTDKPRNANNGFKIVNPVP